MKRVRAWLIGGAVLLVLFCLLLVATAFLPDTGEQARGSITNSRPDGARALAQVLRSQGVAVTQVTTLAEAEAAARSGSTLAVYLTEDLSDAAVESLRKVAADLVVFDAGYELDVESLSEGAVAPEWWWLESEQVPTALCDDPDAVAAGTLTASDEGFVPLRDDVAVCFPDDNEVGLFVRTTTDHHDLTLIGGQGWLLNSTITDNGNAALALRTLGRHDTLTWYLPGPDALPASEGDDGGWDMSVWSVLPGWAQAVFWLLLVAGAAAAVWRGRRFGALVREKLPVAVPASEASAGLGRLYRQSGARGHAAAALRAACIGRLAARLGVPPSASPALVIERVAQAAKADPATIAPLLYGPPPTTDADLVDLATRLNDLEGELTRHD